MRITARDLKRRTTAATHRLRYFRSARRVAEALRHRAWAKEVTDEMCGPEMIVPVALEHGVALGRSLEARGFFCALENDPNQPGVARLRFSWDVGTVV